MSKFPVRSYLALAFLPAPLSLAWNNGHSGNANTHRAAEANNPPYATHDWIPDQALALLPTPRRRGMCP